MCSALAESVLRHHASIWPPHRSSGTWKRFRKTFHSYIPGCNWILLNSGEKERKWFAHAKERAREQRHPTVPCKRLFQQYFSFHPPCHICSTNTPAEMHWLCISYSWFATQNFIHGLTVLHQQNGFYFAFPRVMLTVSLFAAERSLGRQNVGSQTY